MNAENQLPDGIYFDMSEDAYHGQNRLSSSGIQNMMASEADFWANSWLNPDRQDDDTKARQLGRAYHAARLEPARFASDFCRELTPEDRPGALDSDGVKEAINAYLPRQDDYPGILATDTEVKEALAAAGQPKSIAGEKAADRAQRLLAVRPDAMIWVTIKAEWEVEFGPMTAPSGETREQRAQRLVSYGYEGPIYDLEYAAWREAMGTREAIPPAYYDQIVKDMALIEGSADVVRHLRRGQPEVSILWTDAATGTAMKSRIDYLTPAGANDFKTFDNPQSKPLRKAITDAFRYNRYYIQATVYKEAVEQIRSGAIGIGGEPSQAQYDLIAAIRTRTDPMGMRYTFQQKKGVPNLVSLALQFYSGLHASLEAAAIGADAEAAQFVRDRYSNANASAWWRRGKIEVRAAIERFQLCMTVFGEDQPWTTIEADGTLGDDDFNEYWLDMKD